MVAAVFWLVSSLATGHVIVLSGVIFIWVRHVVNRSAESTECAASHSFLRKHGFRRLSIDVVIYMHLTSLQIVKYIGIRFRRLQEVWLDDEGWQPHVGCAAACSDWLQGLFKSDIVGLSFQCMTYLAHSFAVNHGGILCNRSRYCEESDIARLRETS